MSSEIVMPKLSDTMEDGKILRWLKKEGDYTTKGEVIAEIETDKADMELEAFSSGILSKIFFQEGETVPVGVVIAVLGEKDVVASAPEKAKAVLEKPPVVVVGDTGDEPCCTVPLKEEEEEKELKGKKTFPGNKGEKLKISPAARKIVEQEGINAVHLEGSGPGGRIVKEDVEKYLKSRSEKEEPRTVELKAEKRDAVITDELIELTKIRASIGKRMTQSKQTIPHFYVTREVNMGEAVKLIDALNQRDESDEKVTYNDLVIKACGLALREHPQLNGFFEQKGPVFKQEINIGLVVALKVGLLVPIVKNADKLTLKEISITAKGLRERILKRESTPDDLTGGTFTISNMGMFGVDEFSAIINPPQVAIMAVAAIRDIPVIKEGKVQPGKIMKITLSADHRALDGLIVARFLQKVKELLENPITLVLQ